LLKVAVFGAAGRMGSAVCTAVRNDPQLELVAAVDPVKAGEPLPAAGGLLAAPGAEALSATGVEVAVDFTVAGAALANARWCAANGVHCVVGTTGFGDAGLEELQRLFAGGPAHCVVAPNFAIGAVLMLHFAELAAPWFESVEVVELHHDTKVDAPSGTSLLTATRVAAARRRDAPGAAEAAPGAAEAAPGATSAQPSRGLEAAPGVRVHSVRLRGLVAHQEVLFGTNGEVLTLRHDSLDRSSFMPGVLLAVKAVPSRPGLTLGLAALLGL